MPTVQKSLLKKTLPFYLKSFPISGVRLKETRGMFGETSSDLAQKYIRLIEK